MDFLLLIIFSIIVRVRCAVAAEDELKNKINSVAATDCEFSKSRDSGYNIKLIANRSQLIDRYVIRYCKIDSSLTQQGKISKSIPPCLGNFTLIDFDTDTKFVGDVEKNQKYFFQCGAIQSNNTTSATIDWGQEYVDGGVGGGGGDNPKFVQSIGSQNGLGLFVEPNTEWRPSDKSTLVILILGGAFIALGIPFAVIIACWRKKQRARATSLVSGKLR